MCDAMNLSATDWVLVFFPDSDPDPQSEFEIVNKNQVSFDGELEANSLVTVNYGSAKVQAIVVVVADDREKLENEFAETAKDFKEKQLGQVKKLLFKKQRKRKNSREVIKTKSDTDDNGEIEINECERLKRENDKLNRETEKLKRENERYKRHWEEVQHKYRSKKETLAEMETKCETLKREFEKISRQHQELSSENVKLKRTFADVEMGVEAIMKKLKTTKNENPEPTTERPPFQRVVENNSIGNKENSGQMVQIGSGGTEISWQAFNSINWTNHSAATRKLLITLFGRDILATHSLTGKPSPAFISVNKQTKTRLNPTIISDIVEIVMKKCNVSESQVRAAITTKCADENKMQKKKLKKEDDSKSSDEDKQPRISV